MSRDTSVIVSAGAVAAWLITYVLVLAGTKRQVIKPGPPTEELRPESPAVVCLLVNDFEAGTDLAEATIFDLAARKFLELRDTGGRATVHMGADYPTGLSGYEQQIFDQVSGTATAGQVAVNRLDVRKLGKTAIREAHDGGLTRARFDRRILAWLLAGAVLAAAGVAGAIYSATASRSAFAAGLLTLAALGGLILAGQRVQHSAQGMQAARHWLGVRDFMRSYPGFAEQSPATIGKWGRYLAYGVALGVSHAASEAVGVTRDDRTLLWSPEAPRRLIRVRYPGGWDRYGRSAPDLFRQAGMRLAAGAGIGYLAMSQAIKPGLILAGYLILRAGYLAARTGLDLVTTSEISGTVLRRDPWRRPRIGVELYLWRIPAVDYAVVDDGRSDRLTAWALPATIKADVGAHLRIKARPWSRRIIEATLVESTVWHSSSSEPHSRV